MSYFKFEDLPDEVILLTFSYLEISDLIHCSHVSKRIRAISHDESLWQSINLYWKVYNIFLKLQKSLLVFKDLSKLSK